MENKHAVAHNKVMVIDGETVITGSFNFTKAAEAESSGVNPSKFLLGDGAFKAKVLRRIERIKVDEEIPQAKRLRKRVSIDAVIEACQLYYGKNREELVKKVKGNDGRQVAIYLAKILSGEKGKEIGQHFGIKGPAVSDAIKRIEGRLEKENKLREKVEFLKGRIVPEF